MVTVRAVIGAHTQVVRRGFHFIFQDQQIFGTRADHAGDLVAALLHGPRDRVQHRHARTAAHAQHVSEFFDVRRTTQRSDHVLIAVPHLQTFKEGRGFANHHVNDRDGALFRIGFSHGQGNAFPCFVGFEDDELTGLGLARDQGGFDFVQNDSSLRHFLALNNVEHFHLL